MAKRLLRDDKWHRGFATKEVKVQTDFGRYEMVINEPIYYKYNENLDAIGAHPYVYATENTRKFHHIKDEDISDEESQLPYGVSHD